MRIVPLIVALAGISSTAHAKYDPCDATGSPWLAAAGPIPRNAKIWLLDQQDVDRAHYRLRGPGVDRTVTEGREGFLDLGALAPDARYELTVPDWGDYRVAELETTGDEDRTPPGAPAIRSLALGTSQDPEAADDVGLDVDLSGDTVFVDVEIRSRAGLQHELLWREDLPLLGRTKCIQKLFVAGETACVTLRAVDLANNRSEPATRCAPVADRQQARPRRYVPLRQFPMPVIARPDASGWARCIAALAGVALSATRSRARRRRTPRAGSRARSSPSPRRS